MYRTTSFICFLLLALTLSAQRVGNVTLKKGQVIHVRVEMTNNSFQTAGAQVINFRCNGFAVRNLTCTNISPNRFTIHYEMQELAFTFDGMGQKKSFDSKNEEDLNGPFGPYFKKILSKKYDIILDSSGRIISMLADTTKLPKPDEKMITVTDMLKPIMDELDFSNLGPSFFTPLPSEDSTILSMPWESSIESATENSTIDYKLNSITDSTVLLDIGIDGKYNNSSEIMGRITKTNQSISGTGKMIVDRRTGLLKTKAYTANSKGTREAMGGTVPINGKVEILVSVSLK